MHDTNMTDFASLEIVDRHDYTFEYCLYKWIMFSSSGEFSLCSHTYQYANHSKYKASHQERI